jgi:hypothetical protein
MGNSLADFRSGRIAEEQALGFRGDAGQEFAEQKWEMGSGWNGANLGVIWDEIRASWGTNWCADSDVGEACRMEVLMIPHHEFWWRASTH